MRNVVKVLFLIFSLTILTNSHASELTEESVKHVISAVDNAVNTLNADEVAKTLSSNVSITMNIDIQGQKQVLKPSKREYISMLQQGWAQYKNYKYHRSNVRIKIHNNKAFVTADISESMTIQGQNISGTSKEEVTIELVDGEPLITKVTGYVSM